MTGFYNLSGKLDELLKTLKQIARALDRLAPKEKK